MSVKTNIAHISLYYTYIPHFPFHPHFEVQSQVCLKFSNRVVHFLTLVSLFFSLGSLTTFQRCIGTYSHKKEKRKRQSRIVGFKKKTQLRPRTTVSKTLILSSPVCTYFDVYIFTRGGFTHRWVRVDCWASLIVRSYFTLGLIGIRSYVVTMCRRGDGTKTKMCEMKNVEEGFWYLWMQSDALL